MTKKILIFLAVICLSFCILDEQDRYCLVNSLAVGGDNDKIMNWGCKYCNKSYEPTPLNSKSKNIRIVQGYASDWLKKKFTQDFKAIITLYDNFIILAFKFTDNIPKLFVDLYANPKNLQIEDTAYEGCDHCKAHRGFFELWENNKKNVFQSLLEIYKIKKVKKLYITGISLGGALAVMSFVEIMNEFPQFTDIQVTTFGAPRVGNKQFVKYFDKLTNQSSKRFVVKNDPIPNLPPKLFGTYEHAGVQYLCDVKKQSCDYKGHLDNYQKIQNEQDFLKTLNNPSMFNVNICKSGKHSHHFLKRRDFSNQLQLQLQNNQNQLSQSHQFQKHDDIINHICDYPKLLFFAPKSSNDYDLDSSGNNIIFGKQYRKMLVHSIGVFSNNNQIKNWNFTFSDQSDQPSNLSNTLIFQNNSTGFKAMITTYQSQRNNKYMVLTFRGSYNAQNWKSNFDKPFIQYQNCKRKQCKVHQGFYKLWKTASSQIIENLRAIIEEKNIQKIYLTGVSLGGALAQICVIDLLNAMDFLNISVVTFGSPRVGNKIWGDQYKMKLKNFPMTQRFTLQKDPVPVVPAWSQLINWHQRQQYFQIGVQDKCDIQQKICTSQGQGDNGIIIKNPKLMLDLQNQVKELRKTITKYCNKDPFIYCGPSNKTYPKCVKVESKSKLWDFNVHLCNYPKLFNLPSS